MRRYWMDRFSPSAGLFAEALEVVERGAPYRTWKRFGWGSGFLEPVGFRMGAVRVYETAGRIVLEVRRPGREPRWQTVSSGGWYAWSWEDPALVWHNRCQPDAWIVSDVALQVAFQKRVRELRLKEGLGLRRFGQWVSERGVYWCAPQREAV